MPGGLKGRQPGSGTIELTLQETDKATIDVEAQDDGVMGKIVFQAGSKGVPVGEVIAVLAEEGDDLSKLEVPSDLSPHPETVPTQDKKEEPKESKPASKEATKEEAASKEHLKLDVSKPMLPSVQRLLEESNMSNEQISKIKGTGRHGMLTRGDVLAALGKISSPYGSAAGVVDNPMGASGKRANDVSVVEGITGLCGATKGLSWRDIARATSRCGAASELWSSPYQLSRLTHFRHISLTQLSAPRVIADPSPKSHPRPAVPLPQPPRVR